MSCGFTLNRRAVPRGRRNTPNPGKYSFAAPGAGSTPHLSGEIFRLANNLDLPTVQFSGAAPEIQSTVGGHTPVLFGAAAGGAANPTRPAARAGGEGGKTLAGPARRGDHGRGGDPRAGGLHADGDVGTSRYANRHYRSLASGDRQSGGPARGAAAPCFQVVANSPAEFAARIKTENAEMGARDPRCQDQAARGTVALARRRAGFDIACSSLIRSVPWPAAGLPFSERLPTPRHVDLPGQQ